MNILMLLGISFDPKGLSDVSPERWLLRITNLLVCGTIAYFLFRELRRASRKRVELTKRIVGEGTSMVAEQCGQVMYASGSYFDLSIKTLAYEAIGILSQRDEKIVFEGHYDKSDKKIKLEFFPGRAKFSWMGRKLRNGLISWFLIEQDGGRHYFSAEIGKSVLGSEAKSRALFEKLSRKQPISA